MRFTLKNPRSLQYIDYQNVRKTEFLGCQSQEKGSGGVRDAGCEDGRFTEGGVVALGTRGARWAALQETQRAEV